jgi:hypothetical protein
VSCCCQLPDLNLTLPVGTAPSWTNVLINPETADSRVDITDGEFEFLVKESPSDADADAVFTLTTDGGEIVITDAEDGEYQIDNTVDKSGLLEAGRWYYWYLRVTLPSEGPRLARKGKLYAEAN